jgi:DNA adenine methylase
MLSNHNTPLIQELYKDYKIDIVKARRNVNSKADKR